MAAAAISSQIISVDGVEVFLRRRAGEGEPAVFVHGNPDSSSSWVSFMQAVDGPSVAFDLPGFGRSSRPDPTRFDYGMLGYARFVERLLEVIAVDRYRLAVHDWGVVGLIAAAREPERLSRLVIIDAVPLLPGYRWHWLGRLWRRRGVGEAFNRVNSKPATRLLLRRARPRLRPMPARFVDEVWAAWDPGMAHAILALYRSGDPEELERAGRALDSIQCPTFVLWGDSDPYIPTHFARAYAERIPEAELEIVPGAGHWPWVDAPRLISRVAEHLSS